MKLLTLLLSLLLVGCNENSTKEKSSVLNREAKAINCVQQIFVMDSIYGEIRNHASENISMSETINNYSEKLKSLDYSNCPEEFKSAFYKHIEAWQDFRKVSNKYPSLRGELHDIFAIIEKGKDSTEFKASLDQILETWKLVEEKSNK